MMRRVAHVVAALAMLAMASAAIRNDSRPIFQYCSKPDPNYSWSDTGATINGSGWTGYVLNLTSQQWLTTNDVDRVIWYHQLVVIVPDEVEFKESSAIYVTGGGNGDAVPGPDDEDILVTAFLAVTTKTITATLFQVPNQPLVFTADPTHSSRGEDALVAFSWNMYMQNQNRPEWVSLLPMTKSVVRAMDTITDYVEQKFGNTVKTFSIAGASKRGWTTWMTGIVDDRVVAIMPIVMDMLNFEKGVAHMYQAYGGWTFAFEDYWNQNLTIQIGTENMAALQAIVDPLQYAEYLTIPKLIVDATGDEFFMPDDDWYWWGQLPGETYRLMIQDAEHSMATGLPELLTGADAFFLSVLTNSPRPDFSWSIDFQGTGKITLTTNDKPSNVMLRFATTFDDKRRDFRLIKGDTPADPCTFIPVHVFGTACVNPVLWFGESIAPTSFVNGTYTYEATQPLPASGWRAFLLEMYYPGPRGTSFRMTSQVSIIPNTMPFPPCGTGADCLGVLV